MLRENTYKWMYRSFNSNFEKDFFYPSYANSIRLERASGYFSLNSLTYSIDGLLQFLDNGGDILLICNPELSAKDIALIDAGTNLNIESISQNLIESIEKEYKETSEWVNSLDVVCNMISEKRLMIKIAFKKCGIYHEKFGIFYDEEGDRVYFNGSANETRSAKSDNFESFQVTLSWRDETSKVIIDEEENYFHNIWNNRIESLEVVDFPQAVKEKLFKQYRRSKSLQEAIDRYKGEDVKNTEKKNAPKQLYPYQQKAIDEFVENGFHHFYEMATGTGKTFTAIKTIQRLMDEIECSPFTIILVPQIDLQTQWEIALKEEGYNNVFLMGGSSNNATDEFDKAIIEYYNSNEAVCVAVYDSFFGKICNYIEDVESVFLIVDEAHNISPKQFKMLSKRIEYRLGLSATIKRFNGKETEQILSFFTDDTIAPFYYGIEEAIENGFLSRYNYYPLYVNLSEDEFSSYQGYTKSIATELNKPDDEQDQKKLDAYRRERSRIIKQATNKITLLNELVQDEYDFKNSVVYCGQGKDRENEDNSIIDAVTKILGDSNL